MKGKKKREERRRKRRRCKSRTKSNVYVPLSQITAQFIGGFQYFRLLISQIQVAIILASPRQTYHMSVNGELSDFTFLNVTTMDIVETI